MFCRKVWKISKDCQKFVSFPEMVHHGRGNFQIFIILEFLRLFEADNMQTEGRALIKSGDSRKGC